MNLSHRKIIEGEKKQCSCLKSPCKQDSQSNSAILKIDYKESSNA